MSITTNAFGQPLSVGDVVGWGHRNGNMSAHQVGVILEFRPYEVPQRTYDYDNRSWEEHPPLTRYKIKCVWLNSREYTSTCEARDVFLLDVETLDEQLALRCKATEAYEKTHAGRS
ncbi:hypothetical protein MYRNA_38 [Mycobacterium phage Myrna]|uniref:Uncharacterized protein n=1 Tax=Mycobacterium phage Myrna TaxID=546805 RepID=B5LJ49_9CAUD|nr:gp38 [Mycobacterium phage Myrna]ACH62046.1 hypothetical protein MYRNA_38 [Mycobacterium phage Myrna]